VQAKVEDFRPEKPYLPTMSYRILLTGASGMVGRAVLLECLDDPAIERVRMVNRRPVDMIHPKLDEVLLADFADPGPVADRLSGFDACFYCAGVSSVGKSEEEFYAQTFVLVTSFARTVLERNPGIVFTYVSGAGTDTNGRQMWARVKGRTEDALLAMDFGDAYMFRLGMMLPDSDVQSKTGWVNTMYTLLRPLFPLFQRSKWVTTSTKMGRAMINTLRYPPEHSVLESQQINELAASKPQT
jgi:uncharacterized protein YbjT (DUF2867 family)